jgi:Zn-dependent protease with chaperone function
MDSAARNFLALAGISALLVGEAICTLAVYVAVPLLTGSARPPIACLVPTIVLGGLLAASIWIAADVLHRSLTASRRLARRVQLLGLPITPELREGADAAGLGGRVDLVNASDGFSFVYGLLRPRVAISRGLVARLSAAELRAALEHEHYHVRNRDPLRSLIGAVLAEALFLLPSLSVLRRRYEASRELAADRRAERLCGPRPLLGALLAALEEPGWRAAPVSAPLGDPDLLSIRLTRIETGRGPRRSRRDLASLAWSVFGVAVLATSFAAAIVGVGGNRALLEAVRTQLSPAGVPYDALCVVPLLALPTIGFFGSTRLDSGG